MLLTFKYYKPLKLGHIYNGTNCTTEYNSLTLDYVTSKIWLNNDWDDVIFYLEQNLLDTQDNSNLFDKFVRDYISYIPYSPENEKLVEKILSGQESNAELLKFIQILAYHNLCKPDIDKAIYIGDIFRKWFTHDKDFLDELNDFITNDISKHKLFSGRKWFFIIIIGYRILLYCYEK